MTAIHVFSDNDTTAMSGKVRAPALKPGVWGGLSMDAKRAVLDALVTVTILASGSGKAFDLETERVTWKA